MIAALLALCLLAMAYLMAKMWRGIDFIKMTVFAVCGFFFLYTVVSGIFFWADCFQFVPVLLACFFITLLAAGVFVLREKKGRTESRAVFFEGLSPERTAFAWNVTFHWKKSIIPLLIALCALPFTLQKFELYSMGQDQGTYQVKALCLMEYDTHNYMEMEEFTKLKTPEEKQKYLDFVYGQNNLYLPRVIEETRTDASQFEKIVGTIHGLPTYSALLALWGKIFGYAHMIGVQTILYLALLFLSWYVCENMGFRKTTAAFVTALMAASPIVLWLSKSSLTEIGLALIVCAYLYFLTEPDGKPWRAMLPLIAFSFFHISVYVFMPVFVIVFFVMYLAKRQTGWLAALAGTLLGYWIGAFWAFSIAPYYSYGNYSVLWKISRNILNEKNIKPVICGLCLFLLLLCIWLAGKRGKKAAEACCDYIREKSWCSRFFIWCIRLILAGSVLFFAYKGIMTAEHTTYCEYLQISTYIYMSGILLVPLLYILLVFRTKLFLKTEVMLSLVLLFLYCIVAYSAFMRLDVLFYYYYARYVAIFLMIIFLLAAYAVDFLWNGKKGALCILAISLLTFFPYDAGFLYQKDHTRCEWEVLGDVCEDITKEDAFIVGPDEQQIVFIFPVKALTGCDVYYADENLDKQTADLAKKYEHVYYLDYDGALEERFGVDLKSPVWEAEGITVSKTYTNWNHLSYLDYFNITNPFTPIPLNYVEYRLKLSLYDLQAAEE